MKFRPAPSVSQHNLLNHFRESLNRLQHFFPVSRHGRKRKKRTENFVIFAAIISPRYLYLFLSQFRISKDFWIYAVRKKGRERMKVNEREKERENESNNYTFARFRKYFIEAKRGEARPGSHHRRTSS